MVQDEWAERFDADEDDTAALPGTGEVPEYVQHVLPDGEPVRFRRVYGGHRFTDDELSRLTSGMDIAITTTYARGVMGGLEWRSYNGHDYYGFSPWDAEAYTRETAPFPLVWNGHVFDGTDERILRAGKPLLLAVTNRAGRLYGVNVTFAIEASRDGGTYWAIVPRFDEFNRPAEDFTRETAPFLPVFGGKRLSTQDVERLRSGAGVRFEGVSRTTGRAYVCRLYLRRERKGGVTRWALVPEF